MPRDLEKEITALFRAKTEQLPTWHEIMQPGRGDEVIAVRDALTLLYGLLQIHREIIIRLAREIDDVSSTEGSDP